MTHAELAYEAFNRFFDIRARYERLIERMRQHRTGPLGDDEIEAVRARVSQWLHPRGETP